MKKGKIITYPYFSVQIRTMLKDKPPFKIIAPGRTYRSDSDQTHSPMFHQVEGLHIDNNINMGHLKGCLNYFIKEFFEVKKIKMRFRPSHFLLQSHLLKLILVRNKRRKNTNWRRKSVA